MAAAEAPPRKRKIGLVGFGALGQFLYAKLTTDAAATAAFDVAWVWNRTAAALAGAVPASLQLADLGAFETHPNGPVDVIVEVAHPAIYAEFGTRFLAHADLFVGSPTVLADPVVGEALLAQTRGSGATAAAGYDVGEHKHSLFLPSGALWGAQDIAKMGARGNITALHITMTKPAESFRLEEPLKSKLEAFVASDPRAAGGTRCVLYDGPVRGLCPLAPNNVNTMACAAVATWPVLGFDACRGTLVAVRDHPDDASPPPPAHVVEVAVTGKPPAGRSDPFEVSSRRFNPCDPKAVTASATYPSFLSSLLNTALPGRGRGVHFV